MANLWQNGQKWFILGLTFKVRKKTITWQLFYAKNGSNTNLIFETWHAFKKWQNWPFCKGYLRWSRKIQKVTVNKKGLNETLSIREITSYFARAIAKQNGQCWFILGRNLKERKAYKSDSAFALKYSYAKSRLKNTLDVRQMTRFWKVTKRAILLKCKVRRRGQN